LSGKRKRIRVDSMVADHIDSITGRGTATNTGSRYLHTQCERVDDGWSDPPNLAEKAAYRGPTSQFFADKTKRLITTNLSPDIPFRQSINPYKGCEHGCVYCYARPTHAYLDLSPGLDFESKIFYKTRPREHLIAELGRKNYACSVIAMGTNTDPYQPIEKAKRITREILTTLLQCKHPVSIVTKSTLILRDLDILQAMAEQGLVNVHVSVTTLEKSLKIKLEPRTAGPAARLRTIEELRRYEIPTGAMIAPIIPFINDHEIEALVASVANVGAQAASYVLLRLPFEVKPIFEQWLATHYPLKASRVMAAIKGARGGKAYAAQWHTRMVGEGPIAQLISSRFSLAVKKCGLDQAQMPSVRTDLFVPPRETDEPQMALF